MRTFLVVVVLIVLMVVGGWIVFSKKNGSAIVEFRTDEAKRDVQQVIKDTEGLIEGVRSNSSDPNTTTETAPQ